MPLDRVINLLPFYLILKQQLNLLVFQSLGPRRTGVHFNFLNIYLSFYSIQTQISSTIRKIRRYMIHLSIRASPTQKMYMCCTENRLEVIKKHLRLRLLRSISLKEQLSRRQFSHVPTQKRMVHHHNTKSFFAQPLQQSRQSTSEHASTIKERIQKI